MLYMGETPRIVVQVVEPSDRNWQFAAAPHHQRFLPKDHPMVSMCDDKPLAGQRILVVEDDAMLAFSLVDCLERAGARLVGPFATMIEALDGMTQLDAVDAAILDVGLGGQNSFPLAEALQTTRIPFLFLTGTRRLDLPARFERISHLLKPHSEAHLLRELVKLSVS
jgi:CheY-like chemotaxis protein